MKSKTGLFFTGFAGGIVASRLLPPLFGMAIGSLQVRAGADPFQPLIDEHSALRSMLDEMERTGQESRGKRARLFLQFKRTLAKHAMAEEDIVYPLLTEQAERDAAAKVLYSEHSQMKIALFDLEQALQGEGDWNVSVRSLRALIVPHARQEEEEEFPRLRERLPEAKRVAAGRDVLREEAMVL